MSITNELEQIYYKVDNARIVACYSCSGCNDCPYYAFDVCSFENIKMDIRHLINAVDPLKMFRNAEEKK